MSHLLWRMNVEHYKSKSRQSFGWQNNFYKFSMTEIRYYSNSITVCEMIKGVAFSENNSARYLMCSITLTTIPQQPQNKRRNKKVSLYVFRIDKHYTFQAEYL